MMEDICIASGMSKGSVYYHFKNDALFFYLLEFDQQEQAEKWEQTISSVTTAKEKLYLLAKQYAEMIQTSLALEEFLSSQHNSKAYERLSALRRGSFPVIKQIVKERVSKAVNFIRITLYY